MIYAIVGTIGIVIMLILSAVFVFLVLVGVETLDAIDEKIAERIRGDKQ